MKKILPVVLAALFAGSFAVAQEKAFKEPITGVVSSTDPKKAEIVLKEAEAIRAKKAATVHTPAQKVQHKKVHHKKAHHKKVHHKKGLSKESTADKARLEAEHARKEANTARKYADEARKAAKDAEKIVK